MTDGIVYDIIPKSRGVEVHMCYQHAMTIGVGIQSPLLDILHNNIVAIIIAVHELICLATFYQREHRNCGHLRAINGFYLCPAHHLLLPSGIGTRGKAIAIVESIVHDAP